MANPASRGPDLTFRPQQPTIELNIDTNYISRLPYIRTPELNLKLMIDTGSASSLLRPQVAQQFYPSYIREDAFQIHSVHATTQHSESVTIPISQIFGRPDIKQKHFLFDFNPKYDGLIGIDFLRSKIFDNRESHSSHLL